MAFPTIRPANVAILLKVESTEGTDSSPDPTVDAIPVESDSVQWSSPWTNEAANEATGSLVAGAPLIIGRPATFSFKSRVKGAGAGATYSASVKPPLHQAFQSCGWKGQFTAAVATALATAGTTSSATLNASFPATARALVGMLLSCTAGVGNGLMPAVVEYTAGRVATFVEPNTVAFDTTSSFALPANWTYARTSPSDAAARATDQPSATCYIYIDGILRKFVGCRGVMSLDGKNARPGYATFNFTGIYAGQSDAAVPTNLVIAGHSAPVLTQGSGKSPALSVNGKSLAVSTWSLDAGSQIEQIDDPNTAYGFGAGQIVDRSAMLKIDPLMTLTANYDAVTDIGNATTMPAALRHGAVSGNRWALVLAKAQTVDEDAGTRGKLMSQNLTFQALTNGRDAYSRDTDGALVFS